MELAERIKEIVEQAIPIYRVSTPQQKADCRHKLFFKENQQRVLQKKITDEVFELIKDNQKGPTGYITQLVNDYLDHYFENHEHH